MESLQNSDYAGAPIQTSSDNLYVSILSVKENTQTPPFTRGASNLAAKHCILVIYLQLYFASCFFFFFFGAVTAQNKHYCCCSVCSRHTTEWRSRTS